MNERARCCACSAATDSTEEARVANPFDVVTSLFSTQSVLCVQSCNPPPQGFRRQPKLAEKFAHSSIAARFTRCFLGRDRRLAKESASATGFSPVFVFCQTKADVAGTRTNVWLLKAFFPHRTHRLACDLLTDYLSVDWPWLYWAFAPAFLAPIRLVLSPVLKSHGISLLLHATVLAALYVIQPSPTPFSPAGQTQVVSMLASLEQPTPRSTISLESPVVPMDLDMDSPLDQAIDLPVEDRPIDSTRWLRSVQHAAPQLNSPPKLPNVPVENEWTMKRREAQSEMPEVVLSEMFPPRPEQRHASEPPTVTAIPIDQFVGLEEESSADLSMNQPPAYPREAIQRRLQGVVMLQLRIAASGDIDEVNLLQSSGYRVLDDAAIDAVKNWKGRPAKRWGRAVESVERLPIRFRL